MPILLAIVASERFWIVGFGRVSTPDTNVYLLWNRTSKGAEDSFGFYTFFVFHPLSVEDLGMFGKLNRRDIKRKTDHNGLFSLVFLL